MPDIYNNQTYLQKNARWHAEDAPIKAHYILQLLKTITKDFETIAEAGCGSAEILLELSKQLPSNIQFFGFDISADAISIAKQKENERIKIELKDISRDDEKLFFDVLLVIDVLEHIENYFAFLKGIHNKSNYTIFHIPLDMSVWSLFREKMLIESKQRVGHLHHFTENFIKNILEESGFKILSQLYTPPTFEKTFFKQKLVNSVRKMLFATDKKFASKLIGGYSIMLLAENVAPK